MELKLHAAVKFNRRSAEFASPDDTPILNTQNRRHHIDLNGKITTQRHETHHVIWEIRASSARATGRQSIHGARRTPEAPPAAVAVCCLESDRRYV